MFRKINTFLRENKRFAEITTLLFLILSGTFLRFYDIEKYAFNIDGYFETAIASGSFLNIFYYNLFYFTDPPVGTLFAWLIKNFTSNEYWLRLTPLIPSVASIPLAYLVGKKLFGENGGLILAAIFSYAFYPIILSHEMRSYCLAVFFILCSVYFLLKFDRTKKNSDAAFFFLFMFLSIFTKILAIAFFISIAAFVFLEILYKQKFKYNKKTIKKLAKWSIPCLTTFALAALYFVLQRPWKSHPRLMKDNPTVYPDSIDVFISTYVKIVNYLLIGSEAPLFLKFLVPLMFLCGIFFLYFKARRIFYLFVVGVTTLFAFNVFEIIPMALLRYSFTYFIVIIIPISYLLIFIVDGFTKKFKKSATLTVYCLLLVFISINFYIANNSFYRFDPTVLANDKVIRIGIDNSFLKHDISSEDVVIVDGYNSFYFTYIKGLDEVKEYDNGINHFTYLDRTFYSSYGEKDGYMYKPFIMNSLELKDFYQNLFSIIDKNKIRKIWYINPNNSWPIPMHQVFFGKSEPMAYGLNNFKRYIVQSYFIHGGAFIYSTTPKKVDAFIKEISKSGRPALQR